MEAFSDGVIAVIITIMVLELHVPHDPTLIALRSVLPSLIVYAFSFLVVAVFWVNHHHLVQTAPRATARLLWTNNNLLFWMSLVPFVTAYLGQNIYLPLAVGLYGAVLGMGAVAFVLMQMAIESQYKGEHDWLRYYSRLNAKGVLGVALYASGAACASFNIWVSYAIYIVMPVIYFVPDKRLEEMREDCMGDEHEHHHHKPAKSN